MPVTKASLISSNLRMKPCELSSHRPRDNWEVDRTPASKDIVTFSPSPSPTVGEGSLAQSQIISVEAEKGRGLSFEGYKGRNPPLPQPPH